MNDQHDSEILSSAVVGIAWYSQHEWDRIRDQVADSETFDYPYEEWLANAQKIISQLQQAGTRAYRVSFSIDDFLSWCQAQGKQPNSEARSEYTVAETKRIHG